MGRAIRAAASRKARAEALRLSAKEATEAAALGAWGICGRTASVTIELEEFGVTEERCERNGDTGRWIDAYMY